MWLTLFLSWQIANNPANNADRYGKLLAESIATLARAPLLKQDRIGLGLITNQVAGMPGVTGITILGVNNDVLSMTKERARGRDYTHPIALDDAVIGYARITVNPIAVEPQPLWPWVLSALLVLAMPWLLTLFSAASAAIDNAAGRRRDAQLAAQNAAQQAERTAAEQTRVDAATALQARQPPAQRYLVVANLLNQFALTATERQQALSAAAQLAATLAERYGGHSEVVGDTGLALWFDEQQPDRADQVLGCAMLITRLLPELEHRGTFRVALHREKEHEAGQQPDGAVLRDTALMTAAAGAGQVIVSSCCANYLSELALHSAAALNHPLGRDFTTTIAQCQRIETLAPKQEVLLADQFQTLQRQFGSTESESTF